MKLGTHRSGRVHARPPLLSQLSAGEVIGERYRIEAQLGQGGMGIVYAAMHQHTGRAVALKLIQCAWDDDRLELYQRFLSEARAASTIRHPNVVDVLDLGFLAGAPYLVMERLHGESLEDLLTRLEILPLESTLGWLLPVLGALAALHAKGIVHRDVKPSNIFLSRDEGKRVVPKLLDFGLARITHDVPITQPGVMLGTPEYMAPERARGEAVGPCADVWAMGVVAFECMCGRLPFTATTLNGLAAQIVTGDVLRARDANPGLPSALAAVIDRALQNAPEQRHPDMVHFAHALGTAALSAGLSVPSDPDPIGLPGFSVLHLQGQPWASGPLAKIFAAASTAKQSAAPSSELAESRQTPRVRSRSGPGWRVSLALLCVALVAGAMLAWKRPEPPSKPTAAVPTRAPARPAQPALPAADERREPLGASSRAQDPAADIPAPDTAGTIASAQEPGPSADRGEARKRAARRAGTRAGTKRANDVNVAGASEFEKEWK